MRFSIQIIHLILIILLFWACDREPKIEFLSVKFEPAFDLNSEYKVIKLKNGAIISAKIFDTSPNNIFDTISPDTASAITMHITNEEYILLKDSVFNKIKLYNEIQNNGSLDGIRISFLYQNKNLVKQIHFSSPHADDPENEGFYITKNFIQNFKAIVKDSLQRDYLNRLESYIY